MKNDPMTRKKAAFTLVELVIAMVIMAMIALSIAGVFTALSRAYANMDALDGNAQTSRVVLMRIQRTLSRARLVTGVTTDIVVYWVRDDNEDGGINLSELAVLKYDWDSETLTKHRVVFPESMDEATRELSDYRVSLMTAMDTVVTESFIVADAYYTETVLAENVSQFYASTQPGCPKGRMISVKMVLGSGPESVTIRIAAALRLDKTADIGIDENGYFLIAEN